MILIVLHEGLRFNQIWVFDGYPCRCAVESSLFKQWLHNLQTENGVLADGTLALRQVLIQVIKLLS